MTKPFDLAIPPEMRAMAEKSVEQARKAFDGFMSAAEQATAKLEESAKTARAGGQDVGHKAMSFAEQNVASSFELAQKLVAAKDINEMAQLHADYVRRQIELLSEQARELGKTATRARGSGPKAG